MASLIQPSYVPALRMKSGELAGLRDLASDVADHVLPRLIVIPPTECDDMLQRQLFQSADVPNIADILASNWRNRPVFVDITYIFANLQRSSDAHWLPKMFERTWLAGVPAIPLVALSDLTSESREAYKAASGSNSIKLGIVVASGDLVSIDALNPLLQHLNAMGLTPSNCAIFADFGDSDFSNADVVAPIIRGSLELLQEAGTWGQIIFQGTNYPEKNPAKPRENHRVIRNEWKAWSQAIHFDPETPNQMIFGDYAADCAKISFKSGGGRAIPHYRYTTADEWLVERGPNSGTDATAMRDVCQRLVGSEDFAGRGFSSADEFIFLTAQGEAGPGTPTKWRAVNTTHHITRVIADIGNVRGFSLRSRRITPQPQQESLFALF